MSQTFYKSRAWLSFREVMLTRDMGSDLAVAGLWIHGPIYLHHIDPITEDDIINMHPKVFDPENVVCTSHDTHMKIHYGLPEEPYVERRPGDHINW